ncbi:GRIP and coiled-coil domain-containing protein 2-like isoform X2 [Homarus americanus]|uniref:GRIP and coiled-coil domain-containing protein 2-like isoform X2 n=1 Tax=Homarus americanus TaxID=6706 RepID=UPI001C485F03|nr:GRIP and coiled-coil domain-containing protein 2-like isoform X2 [Homarus americanus]
MEAGDIKADKDSGTHHSTNLSGQYSSSTDSQVFDVVVDPLTDFEKVSDLSNQPISPQQSYNLTSPPSPNDTCRGIHKECTKTDCKQYSHLWNSDVSLVSDSGSGVGEGSIGSSGAGGSNNHHRLVVAEVHRFGCRPPCAGSPHDLASCPVVTAASAPHKVHQLHKYTSGKSIEPVNTCDALKALNQAASALALTETLIGPLRIPPVPQEVLNEVVSNMEKKVKVPVPVNSESYKDSTSPVIREAADTQSSSITVSPSDMKTVINSLSVVTCDVGGQSQVPGKMLGSLPSILHPRVHQQPTNSVISVTNSTGRMDNTQVFSMSSKDVRPNTLGTLRQDSLEIIPERHKIAPPTSKENGSRSRVITVPVGMSDHGPVEVYREVHQYPAGSITTVVEKRSYVGQTQPDKRLNLGTSKHRRNSHKLKKKQGSSHYASKSSLVSESSTCTSVASGNTLVSQSSSELVPITQSQASSSKTSLNDTRSDSAGPISRPVLSAAIMQMRQALESVSNVSDNHSDRSSGGIEVASNFSDTSSNLSTLSDLSGYEDEYIKIKRLVSDAVIPPEDYKKIINKVNTKTSLLKPVPSVDYEKVIRDLQAQKEDLEIQLHRLSIQVQNAVREKELYQQQLELMQTKVTETNQKQYFEVLKQRANLEGQLELLKQELENSVYEKNQLQSKVADSIKECEVSRSFAASAKEAESQMKARLTKYEETNKELEEKVKRSKEKIERITRDYEKTEREVKDYEGKNEQLEMSVLQLRDIETQLMGDIKTLRSQTAQLQNECQTRSEAQAQAESSASKASSELQTLQSSSLWYQEQLQIAQSARSNLQQELLEARASLARESTEKETLETKVQTLVQEAEDGQARAVREKASLVAHLEALQADMAEREAVLSQLERDRGSDTKLMEDRRQRLEQDRHQIHKLRLDLSDTERQLDFVRDDLKHKCNLIAKYESELKDLRTTSAVNHEVLRERDTRIENLEQTLREMMMSVKDYQEERSAKDLLVNTLKEEKIKLEISFTAASNEKKEVDDAILKVREDMTKLSSNFYRMKHDLAAKDRQIEVFMREAKDNNQMKQALEMKVEALEKNSREDEEKRGLVQQVDRLQFTLKEVTEGRDKLDGQLTDLKKISKTLEIEKKGLSEAVHLREEQIQNMQGSLESYREALLKKDEELYVVHEQNSTMEKTYMELRRNWEALKEENLALRHDAEAYAEHENIQKREKSDLKESIQKERKLKQSLEKKIDSFFKTHEEEKSNILKEKENGGKKIKELSKELQAVKEEKMKTHEKQVQLETRCNELNKELQGTIEEKVRLESSVKDIVMELDSCKTNLQNKFVVIKTLEVKGEALSKENYEMKDKLISLQNESEKQVTELQTSLQVRSDEIAKFHKLHSDTKATVAKLIQEKSILSSQMNTLQAENTHLKKTGITHENLVKESKSPAEHNIANTKKLHKNFESLHREVTSLQFKLSDSEVKLKETIKQKENLQSIVKNTKKENFLMKAKLKELDVLKKRCKEFESPGKDSKELESMKTKFKELETKLVAKRNELSSLNLTLNEKTSLIQTLKQREQELCVQAEVLQTNKREMEQKLLGLEEIHQRMHEDVSNYQQQLKIAESERDEWMAKYESLRDFIPERDTSTQPAVQLGPTSTQSFSSDHESILVSSTNDNAESLVGNSVNSLGFFRESSQTSVSDGIQFDKTMADLQAQVSLTSEALQSKEQQIHDLQHQLRSLKQEGSNIDTNLQASLLCSDEVEPESVHRKQINKHLERKQQLEVSSSTCSNCNTQKESQPTRKELTEIQSLLNKIKGLESEINGKEVELEEAQTKVTLATTEFSEKRRRYESNVRLLTRKLKEHMKGRKAAEKEMQAQAEDHQRLMNEEQQRYAVLRCRCMELEGQRETLGGQVGGLESEVEEVRTALGRSRQESYDHHNNTLRLQKEIGRLQEICKTADNLRTQVTSLEDSIRQRETQVKEMERVLQVAQEELKQSRENCLGLTSTMQQIKSMNDHIQHKFDAADTNLTAVRQDLKAKEEEILREQQTMNQLQTVNTELRCCVTENTTKCEQLSSEIKQLREERRAVTEENQSTRVHLQDSLAKITALENHIKVVEGEVKAGKEEVSHMKDQLLTKNTSHQVKVTQLEQSVARARQEVVALTSQLNQVQQERVSYQSQATELRTALHSTLRQLKTHKEEEEVRATEDSAIKSEFGAIPSPTPLDLTALTQLMERSARPLRPTLPLTNLESCLSSLKAEVNMLQTQLQNKTEKMAEGLNAEVVAVSETKSSTPNAAESCTKDTGSQEIEIV